MHVHVAGPGGEMKIWLEPRIEFAWIRGLTARDVGRAIAIAEERRDEITTAWRDHFSG